VANPHRTKPQRRREVRRGRGGASWPPDDSRVPPRCRTPATTRARPNGAADFPTGSARAVPLALRQILFPSHQLHAPRTACLQNRGWENAAGPPDHASREVRYMSRLDVLRAPRLHCGNGRSRHRKSQRGCRSRRGRWVRSCGNSNAAPIVLARATRVTQSSRHDSAAKIPWPDDRRTPVSAGALHHASGACQRLEMRGLRAL
jgi:hypothetical protein